MVFESIRARLKVPVESGLPVAEVLAQAAHPMSAADIEGVLVRASRRLAATGQRAVTPTVLVELIRDFQPPAYPLEIEYQRLIAAFECTSRALLPPDLAQLSTDELARRLSALRTALGR